MLMSAEEALATANGKTGSTLPRTPTEDPRRVEQEEQMDADSVFAKLKSLKGDRNQDADE